MLSPLDDRYRKKTNYLASFLDEKALMEKRILMELLYLEALSNEAKVPFEILPEDEHLFQSLKKLKDWQYSEIKQIEHETNHDMKAVEIYLRRALPKYTREWIHYALTSEDVNNLAFSSLFKDALQEVILPTLEDTLELLQEKSEEYISTPMLARTHGQPASPTTFGHEILVFQNRLQKQTESLHRHKIQGKLAGATGGYNAHVISLPEVDWPSFAERFVSSLQLTHNPKTTQVEAHDSWVEFLHNLLRIMNIVIDLDQDLWRYISDAWIVQEKKEGEIGSSAMPHKINPIQFENSEGNARLAQGIIESLSRTLPISRMQRDLSDSTLTRNVGLALGHVYLALKSLNEGLGRIKVNEKEMLQALNNHPEVLAEALQTCLRVEGYDSPYELLRKWTQGTSPDLETLQKLILELDIDEKTRDKLLSLEPKDYIGIRKLD